jgi:hypothetical protein
LVEQVASYALDPLGFVFFAFPWREAGTELVEASGPREWQHALLDELGRRLREGSEIGHLLPILMARASGHGVGKSTVAAWVILWGLSTMPNTRVVVPANTDSQLRTKTWPEVTKWLRLMINRDWFKATATAVFSAQAERERLWRADAIPWSEENTEAFCRAPQQGPSGDPDLRRSLGHQRQDLGGLGRGPDRRGDRNHLARLWQSDAQYRAFSGVLRAVSPPLGPRPHRQPPSRGHEQAADRTVGPRLRRGLGLRPRAGARRVPACGLDAVHFLGACRGRG